MTRRRLARALVLAAVVAAGLAAVRCATNPATGQRQLMLVSRDQEIALGQQADPEIVAAYGLYPDEALQAYVQELGRKLAAVSERPDLPWTFRVVDDPVVNAFALPGGFIYVTRGIMAHLDTEAQLVGVLGHEIGHVTARHGASQMSKAQLATLGLGIGMVAAPEMGALADLAQTGLGLLFLKFSRDDERQADDLGLRYMLRTGHDPRGLTEVFAVLQRSSQAAGGDRLPSWLSTHPDPVNRGGRIAEQIAGVAAGAVNREGYLERLDGMVFGPNPREGFFRDGVFYHPDLAFRFEFPAGWTTRNTRQAVTALSPREDAVVALTLAQEGSPEAAARAFFDRTGATRGSSWRDRIGGYPAASGTFRLSGQTTSLAGLVAFLSDGRRVYRLLGYTREEQWRDYGAVLEESLASFREETDRAILEVEPRRIELVRLDRALTLEEFHRRYPSTVPLPTVALINQLEPGGRLESGTTVKRVVGGPG